MLGPEGEGYIPPMPPQEVEPRELTPEQEAVIDQKREILLQRNLMVGARFVNVEEYLGHFTESEDSEEAVKYKEANRVYFDYAGPDDPNAPRGKGPWNSLFSGAGSESGGIVHLKRQDKHKGGKIWVDRYSSQWYGIAEERTRWTGSSIPIVKHGNLMNFYHQKMREARELGISREQARTEFAKDRLFPVVNQYLIDLLLGKGKVLIKGAEMPVEYSDQLIAALKEKSELINDEDREGFLSIFQKDPKDIDKADLKLLMRYARDNSWGNPTDKDIRAYELLEIWAEEVSEKDRVNLFANLKRDTKLSSLLGVIVLRPDSDFARKVARAMTEGSRDKPEDAHVIMDIKADEFYPDKHVDYVFKEDNRP